jgi:hypothetical protein
MLLRNIVTVHAARLAGDPAADVNESALLALMNSLPQRALEGAPPDRVKLLAAHRQAWQAARLDAGDPRRVLLMEPDPVRRALRACKAASLSSADFSGMVADALATLPRGGRHALAAGLFESGSAGRLVAAVAEQCAVLSALVATPQNLRETVGSGSARHRTWQRVVTVLSRRETRGRDPGLLSNLLTGLFAAGELADEKDVDRAVESWDRTRLLFQEFRP